MSIQPTYVYYHANCVDGIAAAAVAYLVFNQRASYHACHYGQELPVQPPNGARVYILDFSWPFNSQAREALLALSKRCHVVVIDHHKTAKEALSGLDFVTFDQDKCGAVLAWEYFRDNAPDLIFGPVPKILQYVQDRDLWQFRLPHSRAVSAALASFAKDVVKWADLIDSNLVTSHLVTEGQAILRYQRQLIERIAAQAIYPTFVGGHRAVKVHTSILQSEVCEYLLEQYPDAVLAAAFYESPNGPVSTFRQVSLSSRPDFDVSAVAKQYGGGGHPQAAGYTVAPNGEGTL